MDDVDVTTEREAKEAPMRLAASKKPAGPTPTGRCAWCDEIVGDLTIFCDTSCRQDWERGAAAMVRNGRGE